MKACDSLRGLCKPFNDKATLSTMASSLPNRAIDSHARIRAKAIDIFRTELSQMLGTTHLEPNDESRKNAARNSEWLKLLYEKNRDLIHGDMDRAWSILQIFVPVSLAPFAAVAAINDLGRIVAAALAAASVIALLAANLMIDRIKQHERRTWHLVRAIEAEIGLGGLGEGWNLAGAELKGVRFRFVRWSLLLLIAVAWAILIWSV